MYRVGGTFMIYKVKVAYDGSNYAGWQKQENALGIQEVIEKALKQIHKCDTPIVASGRTDAKVHALGQVFHFEADQTIGPDRYKIALNALLPKDIRILQVDLEKDDFHARFSARSKRYDYICTYDIDNPFIYNYKEVLFKKLDIDAMQKAAEYLLGTHDFTSFSSSKIDPRKPKIKTIGRIDIFEENKDVHFIYEGTGFLRYQVRMMTETLIMVGSGHIEVEEVKRILDKKDKNACRFNASPNGLYLVQVDYSRGRQ